MRKMELTGNPSASKESVGGRLYEMLTDDANTIMVDGHKLHRIRAIKPVNNDVPAGTIGGYIEGYHNLLCTEDTPCWVSGDAMVYDRAKVCDCATVKDGAKVCDCAMVESDAAVGDIALISGSAVLQGACCVFERAIVSGGATISDEVVIRGMAQISGKANVEDRAQVSGYAKVHGDATVSGHAFVTDYAVITDKAEVNDNAEVLGNSVILHRARVEGKARIDGASRIGGASLITGDAHLEDVIVKDASIGLNAAISGGHILTSNEVITVGPIFFTQDQLRENCSGMVLTFYPGYVTNGKQESSSRVLKVSVRRYDDECEGNSIFVGTLDEFKKAIVKQYGRHYKKDTDIAQLTLAVALGETLKSRLEN